MKRRHFETDLSLLYNEDHFNIKYLSTSLYSKLQMK